MAGREGSPRIMQSTLLPHGTGGIGQNGRQGEPVAPRLTGHAKRGERGAETAHIALANLDDEDCDHGGGRQTQGERGRGRQASQAGEVEDQRG